MHRTRLPAHARVRARALSLSLVALAAAWAAAPAHAQDQAPAVVTLQLSFNPGGALSALPLSGSAALLRPQFGSAGNPLWVTLGSFDIGSLAAGAVASTSFIPTDPCVGAGTCALSFLFGGFTGAFETFAFDSLQNAPALHPAQPPVVPVGTFLPGDPCVFGGVCRAAGVLVAYAAAPVVVGRWDIAIQAAPVPEPAAGALALAGLAVLGLMHRMARHRA